jgi:transposase
MAEELIGHARGRALIGDTAYDAERIFQAIKRRRMRAVICSHPTRARKRRIDRRLYGQRYLVEMFFHQLKRCRGIATRFEKTAANYLALVQVACLPLWLN